MLSASCAPHHLLHSANYITQITNSKETCGSSDSGCKQHGKGSDSEEELTFTQQCDKNIKKEIAYRRRKEREWKKQDSAREEKQRQTSEASRKREQEEKRKKLEYIHEQCQRIDNEYYEKS